MPRPVEPEEDAEPLRPGSVEVETQRLGRRYAQETRQASDGHGGGQAQHQQHEESAQIPAAETQQRPKTAGSDERHPEPEHDAADDQAPHSRREPA